MENFYYFGICCYKKDDTKQEFPYFLAIGQDGDFTPVGWSFWNILSGSKFVKEESDYDPTYGSKTTKMMTLNDLWVELSNTDRSEDPHFDPTDLLERLGKVFPEFDFYATMYPKLKMNQYYDYKTNLPSEVENAYIRLNDKLQSVEIKDKSSWAYPW